MTLTTAKVIERSITVALYRTMAVFNMTNDNDARLTGDCPRLLTASPDTPRGPSESRDGQI